MQRVVRVSHHVSHPIVLDLNSLFLTGDGAGNTYASCFLASLRELFLSKLTLDFSFL